MRKLDIMIQVLSEVTGKDKKSVEELFETLFVSRPETKPGFMVEVPESEAQKTIETLRKEGPGILTMLQRGAAQVESMGSKTVH